MVQRFQEVNRITAVRDDYSSLRQRGTVGKYINRFRELVVELPDESEEQQVYQFLKGLKSSTQRLVRTHKPATVELAMDIADEAERAHDQSYTGGFRNRRENGSHEAMDKQSGEGPAPMQLGAMDLSFAERDRRSRQGLCFKCGAPGHLARRCTAPRRLRARAGEAQEKTTTLAH